MSAAAPPKFIKVNNIRKFNPAYRDWVTAQKTPDQLTQAEEELLGFNNSNNAGVGGEVASSSNPNLFAVSGGLKSKGWATAKAPLQQSAAATASPLLADGSIRSVVPPSRNQQHALPTVCSAAEHARYLSDTPLSSNVARTKEALEQDAVAASLGVPKDQIMNNLAFVFGKLEIPLGVLEKLVELASWDAMILMADDSLSMNLDSDARHPETRRIMSRWEEVEVRLRYMIEILAYVPCPRITVIFLNRPDEIQLEHVRGEPPYKFIGDSFARIRRVFSNLPRGSTPMLSGITRSLNMFPGRRVLRYIFCDGVPNGGTRETKAITKLLIGRPNPKDCPFTFLSCTNEDDQVLWAKECEERAPFCAELDDFSDEANEVVMDQGRGLNYSYGFWLVSCIVAAINPHDLDALDESAPLTKKTLDRLQGYVTTPQEYDYYFDEFIRAQTHRPVNTTMDSLKKSYQDTWVKNRHAFVHAERAADIPVVEEFRLQVRGRLSGSCCVIQ